MDEKQPEIFRAPEQSWLYSQIYIISRSDASYPLIPCNHRLYTSA